MNGIEERNIMLYSPLQMEVAPFFGGPVCGIYMLTANYRRLEKPKYARNVILIGSIIVFLYLLGNAHPLSSKIPQVIYQAIPVLIVWGICKIYHISKEDIVEAQKYTLRSNWTVLFVIVIAQLLTIISIGLLFFYLHEILGIPITIDLSDLPG